MEFTYIQFFKFSTFKAKLWAFKAMGKFGGNLTELTGAKFAKLMGSGGSGGFGIWPNFEVYCVLTTWQNETDFDQYHAQNAIYQEFKLNASDSTHLKLSCIMAHGLWDKKEPFTISKEKAEGEIAVITRGRIKWSQLVSFWLKVGPSSQQLFSAKGLLAAVGIGELPLIQQATLSIWEDSQAMQNFAYKGTTHKKVIQQTKKHQWYKEELFARFKIIEKSENYVSFFK